MVIYIISRGYYGQRVSSYGFSSLCRFYAFSFIYIYGIHKNGVSLYVVPKWFSLVQDTDGWRKGGVLFSVYHADHTHTNRRTYNEHITSAQDTIYRYIPHKDQMSGHYHSLSMFWCSLCYMCVLYIFSDSISYRWIYLVT